MNDIYHAINDKEYNMVKVLIENIDQFVHEKSVMINECYNTLQKSHMEYISTPSGDFDGSKADLVQKETNIKFKKYQQSLDELTKLKSKNGVIS